MKSMFSSMFVLILLVSPLVANAGIAVIASPSMPATALTVDQVGQVFMGRLKTLPDGAVLTPVDQHPESPVRAEFLERVLGKNEQQVRSYWTRMVFTGKGQPPRSVADDAEMVRAVLSAPGAIGYVDSASVTAKVKVLFRID